MPYTPAQVSAMLDIPPSSLRRLAKELKAYLSKPEGRHRRYTEQDINTLRKARELTSQGESLASVKLSLSLVEEETSLPASADSLALVPTISAELARMDDLYRAVAMELDQLRSSAMEDHERLRRLESWASLPWWKRLFSRPPL